MTHQIWTTCNHQIRNLEHVVASLAGQQPGQKPTCSIMTDMPIEYTDGQETGCSMRQEENKSLKDEILLSTNVRKFSE